jgi:DEAD/DEAH box helicase domain-containing protein
MNPKTKFIYETVDSPFYSSVTKNVYGYWIDVPIQKEIDLQVYTNGVHALEHMILNLAPVYSISSNHFLTVCSTHTLNKILIYDGLNRKTPVTTLAEYTPTIMIRTKQILENCSCADGCENCVLMSNCNTKNKSVSKKDALTVLLSILK